MRPVPAFWLINTNVIVLRTWFKSVMQSGGSIHTLTQLGDRAGVFRDRTHAGEVLADMLQGICVAQPLILGIPAGGVPVAAAIAPRLGAPLDVAVVSKITLPWNTEAGYGAVAFDGTVRLNEALLPRLALSQIDIRDGIEATTAKVTRRLRRLRANRPLPALSGRPVVLVDDGLASGFTMRVAIEAVRNAGAEQIVVAVPTAHARATREIASEVTALYCPNICGGSSFAVADAYERWSDVNEDKVLSILEPFFPESSKVPA